MGNANEILSLRGSSLITGKTAVTADAADYVLISDTSDSGNLKKALVSDFGGSALTLIDSYTVPTTGINYVDFTISSSYEDKVLVIESYHQASGVNYSIVAKFYTDSDAQIYGNAQNSTSQSTYFRIGPYVATMGQTYDLYGHFKVQNFSGRKSTMVYPNSASTGSTYGTAAGGSTASTTMSQFGLYTSGYIRKIRITPAPNETTEWPVGSWFKIYVADNML